MLHIAESAVPAAHASPEVARGLFPRVGSWLDRRRRTLDRCAWEESRLASMGDDALRQRYRSLRYQAKSGRRLLSLLPETYALVRLAAHRALAMRPYDVQLLAGIALAEGGIAEMETGEGKTLTAALPLTLYALAGRGVHLVTANDYLAGRDAELIGPLYQWLGLTLGVVQSQSNPDQRRAAYACDVTYATAQQLGFDFLRDRLAMRGEAEARLGHGASPAAPTVTGERRPLLALVDEADSILIDEARTPLVIGVGDRPRPRVEALHRWASRAARRFSAGEHYARDPQTRRFALTRAGERLLASQPRPALLASARLGELRKHLEQAIQAAEEFQLNRHYVIRERELVIIDENTGRPAEGRQWQQGLHQAIEAKEGLPLSPTTGTAARITMQDLLLRYPHLAGMTGTAASAAGEFRQVYRLATVRIPTHRPARRRQLPTRVHSTIAARWEAIVAEVVALRAEGRPVLIGTKTIAASQQLSSLLDAAGVPHEVLNAQNLPREAEIVAGAGELGRVTVATNMAGRGTDIRLADGVPALGGLHVICSELHDSARVDRQLVGRCARQGDPGSFRQHLSLQDDILTNGFGARRAAQLAALAAPAGHQPRRAAIFRRAQQRVERRQLRQRLQLLYYDRARVRQQRQLGQDPYLDSPE